MTKTEIQEDIFFKEPKFRKIRIMEEKEFVKTLLTMDERNHNIILCKLLSTNKLSNPLPVSIEEYLTKAFSLKFPLLLAPKAEYSLLFTNSNQVQIVFDYFFTGSLENVLTKEYKGILQPKWNNTQKTIVAIGIAYCMNFLHSRDSFHRNLTLSNVLLTVDYEPIISDFWIYPFHVSYSSESSEINKKLISDFQLDDIYSYGIILFHLITHITSPIRALQFYPNELSKYIPSDISPSLSSLLLKCLSNNGSTRPTFSYILEQFRSHQVSFPSSDFIQIDAYLAKIDSLCANFNSDQLPNNGNLLQPLTIIDDKEKYNQYRVLVEKYKNPYAMLLNAICRYQGIGCSVNKKGALKQFQIGAENFIPECQYKYADLVPYLGNKSEKTEGKNMLKYAAELGYIPAQLKYALNFPKNSPIRRKFLSESASTNDPESCYHYYQNYYDTDRAKSLEMLKIAADSGNCLYQYEYAKVIFETNKKESEDYVRKAAYQNYEQAVQFLVEQLISGDSFSFLPQNQSSYFMIKLYQYINQHLLQYRQDMGSLLLKNENIFTLPPTLKYSFYKQLAQLGTIEGLKAFAKLLETTREQEALPYYKEAGDLGDAESLDRYATIKSKTDIKSAIPIWKKAAEKGIVHSMICYGRALNDSIERRIEILNDGIEKLEEAAKLGSFAAKSSLARYYFIGYDEITELSKSYSYSKEVTEFFHNSGASPENYGKVLIKHGDYEETLDYDSLGLAQMMLGINYKFGYYVKKDYKIAIELLEEAIATGGKCVNEAKVEIASMLDDGDSKTGFPADPERSKQLINEVEQSGDFDAIYYLGLKFIRGETFPIDYQRAAQLFQKGCKNGHQKSILKYSHCLRNGIGVAQDSSQARYYKSLLDTEKDKKKEQKKKDKFTYGLLQDVQKVLSGKLPDLDDDSDLSYYSDDSDSDTDGLIICKREDPVSTPKEPARQKNSVHHKLQNYEGNEQHTTQEYQMFDASYLLQTSGSYVSEKQIYIPPTPPDDNDDNFIID